MNLANWSRLGSLEDFFNRPFSGFLTGPESADMPSLVNADIAWRPAADISETEKEYRVKAQLPGVDKKDVNISFDRGILKIEGERKVEKSSEKEEMRRTESFYGKYSRSFALPEGIDEKKVSAQSKDGVLTIRLPKVKEAAREPKRIPIE